MNEYYLFLNSCDSESYKYNKLTEFTNNLPRTLDLSDGEWELGLTEIHFDTSRSYSKLYVCCDMINSSFTPNKTEQILRYIPYIDDDINEMTYSNVYYFDVMRKFIDRIRIYIKTDNSYQESLSNETLYCTLHIRKKR